MASEYVFLYLVAALGVVIAAWYAYSHRKALDQMCCNMVGMVFGAVPALVVGTLFAMETGDFVWAMIYGTIAGYVVGVPMGRLGGGLGRMEAVFAAPSAGLMGGMLGVTARVYDVKLFTLFIIAVAIGLLAEMSLLVRNSKKVSEELARG